MSLICSEKNRNVSLEEGLRNHDSLIVSVDPFVNDLEVVLQIEKGRGLKGVCCHLHGEGEAFTTPHYFSDYADIPKRTYFVLLQGEHEYTVLFCLSHQDVIVSLSGIAEGVRIHLSSGNSTVANRIRPILVCMRGTCLHSTIGRAMELALKSTGGLGKLLKDKLSPPLWLDTLGWESGIALGINVSHHKIVESVSSLCDAGYPPGYVLIDEGWQHLASNPRDPNHRMALASFEADRIRFPQGLKGIVSDLNSIKIKHVGVWHGMMGHRAGIHPDLAKLYDLPPASDARYFLGYDLGRTFQFFYDYYEYLRQQGIDFIKVGDQSNVGSYCRPGMDATLLYKNLQSAIQAAASIQFSSAHFNTECLCNENLFYWGNSRLARAAEDIDILNPIGAMRAIRNNLVNALWLQHLMQSDFDAWMTETQQSEMLAIFHALSGTINVIGDLAGIHQKNLLKKLVLPGGALLKADKPLTLCEDVVFINPIEQKHIYKAFTMKGQNGMIAAFNLTEGQRTLHGTISPKDVVGLEGGMFAAFSHHNGYIGLFEREESFTITLKPNQSDVITIAPVKNGIAVFGCYHFFLAPGPIIEIHIEDDSMHISSLVAAPMVLYCEKQILDIRCNGHVVPWEYDIRRRVLSIDSRSHIANCHSVYHITFE